MKTLCIASTALLALFANGCVVDHHHHDDDGGSYQPTNDPYFATVDRGEVLTTDLGQGAGLFVEYTEGGSWAFWASCDTDLSGRPCLWDVYVSSQEAITGLDGPDLEDEDSLDYSGDSTVVLYTTTTSGSDTMTFQTEPGALTRVEVYLDGDPAPGYLVWFNDGVQNGAPYMPVIFQPDAP